MSTLRDKLLGATCWWYRMEPDGHGAGTYTQGTSTAPTEAATLIDGLASALAEAKAELWDSAHSSGDPDDAANMASDAATYRSVRDALEAAHNAGFGQAQPDKPLTASDLEQSIARARRAVANQSPATRAILAGKFRCE